jgi:hypothetical protein
MISKTVGIRGIPVDYLTMDETVARIFSIEEGCREILTRVNQARPDPWTMQELV